VWQLLLVLSTISAVACLSGCQAARLLINWTIDWQSHTASDSLAKNGAALCKLYVLIDWRAWAWPTYWPWLWQSGWSLEMHSSTSMWQRDPVKPVRWQSQLYDPTVLIHRPPFSQPSATHSSTSSSHNSPVNPVPEQLHVKLRVRTRQSGLRRRHSAVWQSSSLSQRRRTSVHVQAPT